MKFEIVDEIGVEINSLHDKALLHAMTAIESAIRIGELLIQKKAMLNHGEYKPWIAANCRFSYPMAHKYMQVARLRATGMLPDKAISIEKLAYLAPSQLDAKLIFEAETAEEAAMQTKLKVEKEIARIKTKRITDEIELKNLREKQKTKLAELEIQKAELPQEDIKIYEIELAKLIDEERLLAETLKIAEKHTSLLNENILKTEQAIKAAQDEGEFAKAKAETVQAAKIAKLQADLDIAQARATAEQEIQNMRAREAALEAAKAAADKAEKLLGSDEALQETLTKMRRGIQLDKSANIIIQTINTLLLDPNPIGRKLLKKTLNSLFHPDSGQLRKDPQLLSLLNNEFTILDN